MINLRTIRALFGPWLRHILWLDALGASLLVLLWALAGDGMSGLGPYLREVGRAALTLDGLILYLGGVLLYSVAIELALRMLVQRPLMRARASWARRLALPAAALAYGALHLKFNPAGFAYATALGAASALIYQRTEDWRVLATWHAQWNLLAVGGALLLALAIDGPARHHMLFEYKKAQITSGQLTHVEGWGWVDAHHYDHERMLDVTRWIDMGGPAPLTMRATVTSQLGTRHEVTRTYALEAQPVTPRQRWAAACSVVMDFNRAYEQRQETLGLWAGTQLSAWQADDLPSTLRMCLDAAEFRGHSEPRRVVTIDQPELLARWDDEGMQIVARREDRVGEPHHITLDDRETRLVYLLAFGEQFWRHP